MKQKINLIIPYFGSFPNYMQLFLNSCGANPDFHWTIITDNTQAYDFPQNVTVIKKEWEDAVEEIRNKFDFPICLSRPYKLCDMKPMYGFLFEEYNVGYDFWGYCDLDLIWGNLSKFVTEEILQYDKIFKDGHLTIIRNLPRYNELFKREINGHLLYKEVLQTDRSCNFDEDFNDVLNINSIFRQEGIPVYVNSVIADIYTKSSAFQRVLPQGVEKKSRNFYIWNHGELTRKIKKQDGWNTEEYMYIHLQKRKMKVKVTDISQNVYKIIPNEFADLEIQLKDLNQNADAICCKKMNMQYFRIRSKNLRTKIKNKIKR